MKPRTTKSNVGQAQGDGESVANQLGSNNHEFESEQEDERENEKDQLSMAGNDDFVEPVSETNETVIKEAPQNIKRKPDRKSTSSKLRKISAVDEKQMHPMEEIERELMRDRELEGRAKCKDSMDTFCEALAMEIRQFDEQERCIIKHEINNVILKHQMTKFNPQPSYLSPSSSYTSFQTSQGNDYAYNGQYQA